MLGVEREKGISMGCPDIGKVCWHCPRCSHLVKLKRHSLAVHQRIVGCREPFLTLFSNRTDTCIPTVVEDKEPP